MKLIIASNNRHKVKEIKQILTPWFTEVLSLNEAGVDIDVEEDGATFEENADKKAREVFAYLGGGCAVLSDDSGIEIDALGGAPGVYSARYCGVHGNDEANNALVLKNMENVEDGKRTGRYVCAIALYRPDCAPIVLRGTCEGVIARDEKGENGFGYDPLFYLPDRGCTMAQISDEEKNAISHRGNALELLRQKLTAEEQA